MHKNKFLALIGTTNYEINLKGCTHKKHIFNEIIT